MMLLSVNRDFIRLAALQFGSISEEDAAPEGKPESYLESLDTGRAEGS